MVEQVDILLIDDSQADVQLTIHALECEGLQHRLKVLRDGEEALKFLMDCLDPAPRLILLDLKLPKVNGHEVLKAVKSDPAMKSVPIVILTSSAQESDISTSYRLGANSYIQKPVDFEAFCAVIQQVRTYWLELNQSPVSN
ncbi:MAG TPA: response regulator [Candidatus Angelobacter sp.]|nr:response regulator [Candidatus Angelobacter sp.]